MNLNDEAIQFSMLIDTITSGIVLYERANLRHSQSQSHLCSLSIWYKRM